MKKRREIIKRLRREQCGIAFLRKREWDCYGGRKELDFRDKEISKHILVLQQYV